MLAFDAGVGFTGGATFTGPVTAGSASTDSITLSGAASGGPTITASAGPVNLIGGSPASGPGLVVSNTTTLTSGDIADFDNPAGTKKCDVDWSGTLTCVNEVNGENGVISLGVATVGGGVEYFNGAIIGTNFYHEEVVRAVASATGTCFTLHFSGLPACTVGSLMPPDAGNRDNGLCYVDSTTISQSNVCLFIPPSASGNVVECDAICSGPS